MNGEGFLAVVALVLGSLGLTGALLRRRVMDEARRVVWRRSSEAIGLRRKPSPLRLPGLDDDRYVGWVDGVEISVTRVETGKGAGVLRVHGTIAPPLRAGLYASTRPDVRGEAHGPKPLQAPDLGLPYVGAYDEAMARELFRKIARPIAEARRERDLTVLDDAIVVASELVGTEDELRAEMARVVTLHRAVVKARDQLGEAPTDAALRRSWERLAERRGLVLEPGPTLRGTLRRLGLVAEVVYHPNGAQRTTTLALACPIPPAAHVLIGPNLGETTNAMIEALFGSLVSRPATSPSGTMGSPRTSDDSITRELRALIETPAPPPRETGPFADRFVVRRGGLLDDATKNACVRLDPRVTQIEAGDEGVKLQVSAPLDADELEVVVEGAEAVAFALMGESAAAGYRNG